jgi:2-hydroxyacyl-CoA lyase 1
MSSDVSVPLNYYAVFATLESVIPKTAYIVSEGANTMDIGRTILSNHLPRQKLFKLFCITPTQGRR